MIYKKITIKNYKGIKKVSIDFSNNRILTLVGLNESGKTTILDAITRFYDLIKGMKMDDSDLNDIRPKGIDFTGQIELSALLEFEKDDIERLNQFVKENNKKSKITFPKTFEYTFKFEYELHTYTRTSKTADFQAKSASSKSTLHSSNKELWSSLVGYIKEQLVPEVLYYEDFIFEIPDKIEYTINDEDADEEEKTEQWKFVLDDILKTVSNKFTSFKSNVIDIWKKDNDTARQRLSIMEKQLDKKITNAWKELFGGEDKENKRLNFKEIKLIPNLEDADTISFSFKVKTDSGKEFSINERSKGCKWFFSFLIFTEFRKSRTKNILFLLDEPASNLHSSAQLKILDAIESLSDKSVVIYSTHSHHLINPKWLNGAYVVINEGISETNLEGALTDTDAKVTVEKYYDYVSKKSQQFQPLYFQPILDRLDYKPSFVEPIPNIIICEGKYDWFTFLYLSKVILADSYQYSFYPGKGRDSNWDILNLYLSWGANFTMILDGDKPGQDSKSKYLKELNVLNNHVYTLAEIIHEEVATEEIFSDNEKELLCDTAFGKDTFQNIRSDKKKLKSKLNFAINQLYITNTRVELEQNTLNKFKAIFDFIKNKRGAT